VLIVTIDEKEYLHLGCLLEEMFPEARIQMVTSVISAKGVVRTGQFSRIEEYLFFVEFGASSLSQCETNMLDDEIKKEAERQIEWLGFRRRAPQAVRTSRPNQFYPVFVNIETGRIDSIGDVVQQGIDRHTVAIPEGCVALWPLSKDGGERLWSLSYDTACMNLVKGYLRVKGWNKKSKTGTVYYLPEGTINDIESGVAEVSERNKDGSVVALYKSAGTTPPKKVWNVRSHNAETFGTNILQSIIGGRFSYPKSLYAVHDAIRFFVADKPDALIVDFFAGSGTTLHAVNLLNAEDGGHRRCIMVTNNEVSEAEAKALTEQGHRPGDAEWEKLGIARYVTWPRTVCSIEGRDVNGNPLKGKYVVGDRPMADGFKANAAFFKLSFQDKNAVALGRQFKEMLPMLWMKAGARGVCPTLTGSLPSVLLLPENRFAVLLSENAFQELENALADHPEIETVYIITDYEPGYRAMAKNLKVKSTYQLYRDYLDNFRINMERNQ
jgi:adenine-specific DNA-methyltransferase